MQVVAAKTGTFYGQPMTAGKLYTLVPARAGTTTMFSTTAAVDHHGNIVICSRHLLRHQGDHSAYGTGFLVLDGGNSRVRNVTG